MCKNSKIIYFQHHPALPRRDCKPSSFRHHAPTIPTSCPICEFLLHAIALTIKAIAFHVRQDYTVYINQIAKRMILLQSDNKVISIAVGILCDG